METCFARGSHVVENGGGGSRGQMTQAGRLCFGGMRLKAASQKGEGGRSGASGGSVAEIDGEVAEGAARVDDFRGGRRRGRFPRGKVARKTHGRGEDNDDRDAGVEKQGAWQGEGRGLG